MCSVFSTRSGGRVAFHVHLCCCCEQKAGLPVGVWHGPSASRVSRAPLLLPCCDHNRPSLGGVGWSLSQTECRCVFCSPYEILKLSVQVPKRPNADSPHNCPPTCRCSSWRTTAAVSCCPHLVKLRGFTNDATQETGAGTFGDLAIVLPRTTGPVYAGSAPQYIVCERNVVVLNVRLRSCSAHHAPSLSTHRRGDAAPRHPSVTDCGHRTERSTRLASQLSCALCPGRTRPGSRTVG